MKRIKGVLLFLTFYYVSFSQSGTKSTIIIYDENNRPLENVNVEVLGHEKQITNREGKVVFYFEDFDIGVLQYVYIYHKDFNSIKDSFWLKRSSKYNFLEYKFGSKTEEIPIKNYFKGRIVDKQNYPVDSALVTIDISNKGTMSYTTKENGIFFFELTDKIPDNTIKINITKRDYLVIDTIIRTKSFADFPVCLFKLRKESFSRWYYGIVMNRSKALENVLVQASGSVDERYKSQYTLTFDNKDNLPIGSFSILTKEKFTQKDSIKLVFSKANFKTSYSIINLENIDSLDLYNIFNINYASPIPNLGLNNITPTFSIPFASKYYWYCSFEYRRSLTDVSRKKFDLGANLSFLWFKYIDKVETFLPNTSFDRESWYKEVSLGLTTRYWILNPAYRYFSTYFGFSVDYAFINQNLNIYPLLGTRVFTNDKFAFVFEGKYLYNKFNIIDFQFNNFGNAIEKKSSQYFSRFSLNVGVSCAF